ncbi:MAG TPA: hypothetical protein VKS21_07665, partial [Spirochaetota bacterium]|nr:hypothetical protein [Spirochaetota bacterium]
NGTLNFSAGVTNQGIIISLVNDGKPEAVENFYIKLTNPVIATISNGQGTGSITDDDGAPVISFVDPTNADPAAWLTKPVIVTGFVTSVFGETTNVSWSEDGTNYSATSGDTTNWFFNYDPAAKHGSTNILYIKATSENGNSTVKTLTNRIDITPPDIISTAPAPDSIVSGTINFTGTNNEDFSAISSFTYTVNTTVYAAPVTNGFYTIPVDFSTLSDGMAIITLKSINSAGLTNSIVITNYVTNAWPEVHLTNYMTNKWISTPFNHFAGKAISYYGGIQNVYISSNSIDYVPVTGNTNWFTNLDLSGYEDSSNVFYYAVSNNYGKMGTNQYTNYFDFTPPELSFANNYNSTTQSNIFAVNFILSNDFAPYYAGALGIYNTNGVLVTNMNYAATGITAYGSHSIDVDTTMPTLPAAYYNLVLSVTNAAGLYNVISNTNVLFTNELVGNLTEYRITNLPTAVTSGSNFTFTLRLYNNSGMIYPANTNLNIGISGPLPSLETVPTYPRYSADGSNFVNTGNAINVSFINGTAQITMTLYRATNTTLINHNSGDISLALPQTLFVYPNMPFVPDGFIAASPSNNAAVGDTVNVVININDEYNNKVTNTDLEVDIAVDGANELTFKGIYNALSNIYTASYLAQNSGQDKITAVVDSMTLVKDTDSYSNDGVYQLDINEFTYEDVSNTMAATGKEIVLADNPVSGVAEKATIVFNAASGSRVDIEIFDILSRLVWQKQNIILQNSGRQEVEYWDLRYNVGPQTGEKVPPGIYFIRKIESRNNRNETSIIKLVVE